MPSLQIASIDTKELRSTTMMQNTDQEQKCDGKATDFEDAVSLTGHGKFHYLLLLGCGLCLVSMISETLSTSYLLPSAQCDFNMSSNEKGLLNAVIYVGMICSSHMWGFLADTRGRRKVLILTLLMDGLCTVAASFMPTFWLFLVLRFFNGIFICGPSAVVYAYLGEFHSEKTRTQAMVWVCVYIALGVGTLPGIAWLVIPQTWSLELPWYTYHSWRVFVVLCGVPALLTTVILWFFMPESPKFLLAAGREEEALDVLRYVYSTNTGNKPDDFPVTALKLDATSIQRAESSSPLAVMQHMWRQTKPIFQKPFLLSTVVACAIQFGLYSSSNGFLLWIPDLFNRMGEYEKLYPNDTATVCQAITALRDYQTMDTSATLDYTSGSINLVGMEARANHTVAVNVIVNATYSLNFIMNATDSVEPSDNHTLLGRLLLGGAMHPDVLLREVDTLGLSTSGLISDTDQIPLEASCNSDVNPTAFQNTLIIGIASSFAYVVVGYLIAFLSKKTLLVVFLLASGACGFAIFFAQTYLELLLVPGFFVVLSGMCVSVVNSVVIDVFPTHLRAMALCLSLMMGRVGTVFSNLMLGTLLELNCALVIFLLSGIVIACGLLSLLLPSPKKSSH